VPGVAYNAINTGCAVHPYPVGAVICQPVLAPVLIVSTTAAHDKSLGARSYALVFSFPRKHGKAA
jgi:hypothetical protein